MEERHARLLRVRVRVRGRVDRVGVVRVRVTARVRGREKVRRSGTLAVCTVAARSRT